MEPQGYQINTPNWILFTFVTPFVFLRLYVQLRLRFRPWREIFVVLAWLLYLGNVICISIEVDLDYWNPKVNQKQWSQRYGEDVMRVDFGSSIFYQLPLYLCKMLLLFFYADLTPRQSYQKTWLSIVLAWIFVVGGVVVWFFWVILSCMPFENNWTWPAPSSCSISLARNITCFVFHLLTDLIVYIIPFVILFNLRVLKTKQKVPALFMFGLGLLNLLSAFSFFAFMGRPPPSYQLRPWYIHFPAACQWALEFQMATAVLIVCLPSARRLWQGLSAEAMKKQSAQIRAVAEEQSAVPQENEDRELGMVTYKSAGTTMNHNGLAADEKD